MDICKLHMHILYALLATWPTYNKAGNAIWSVSCRYVRNPGAGAVVLTTWTLVSKIVRLPSENDFQRFGDHLTFNLAWPSNAMCSLLLN